jgi:hypothetical protein
MRQQLKWTVLSSIGLTAGVASGLVIGKPLQAVVGMMLVTPILTGLVGTMLGTAQWFPLQNRETVRPLRWIAGTSGGLCVGLAGGVVLLEQAGRLLTGARIHLLQLHPAGQALSLGILGLVSGACLGLAQSLAVRRTARHIRQWTLTSAVALSVGFSLASLLVNGVVSGGIASLAGALTFLLAAGILYGGISSLHFRRVA